MDDDFFFILGTKNSTRDDTGFFFLLQKHVFATRLSVLPTQRDGTLRSHALAYMPVGSQAPLAFNMHEYKDGAAVDYWWDKGRIMRLMFA